MSSATDQISKFSITNSNTEQICIKSPSKITTNTNESSTKLSSTTDQVSKSSITNNNCDQCSMKSPSEITTIINESKSPDPTLINNNDLVITTLKKYEPSMYYNFDPCLGDNNNIKTYVRRSITLNIRVEGAEDSNKIKSINLSSFNFFNK